MEYSLQHTWHLNWQQFVIAESHHSVRLFTIVCLMYGICMWASAKACIAHSTCNTLQHMNTSHAFQSQLLQELQYHPKVDLGEGVQRFATWFKQYYGSALDVGAPVPEDWVSAKLVYFHALLLVMDEVHSLPWITAEGTLISCKLCRYFKLNNSNFK